MNTTEMRTLREQLRHELFASLNEIEDIVAIALERIATESVVWGADAKHDFGIDHVAAKAADDIGHELDAMAAKALKILVVVEL
jgi:hypothetical protein